MIVRGVYSRRKIDCLMPDQGSIQGRIGLKIYNCQSGTIKEEKNIFSRSEIKPCNHMLIGMGWDGIHCGFYPLFLPGITFPSSVGT